MIPEHGTPGWIVVSTMPDWIKAEMDRRATITAILWMAGASGTYWSIRDGNGSLLGLVCQRGWSYVCIDGRSGAEIEIRPDWIRAVLDVKA